MMYGLCVGGALTRTVEPPNKASVPRCILGPRWVHTAVPSRVRHAACRALRAVRWLLRCCVACNWLRCMLRNDRGARCIMAFHANASRRMQGDASCVLLLHVASTSSVSSPGCARPSRLPACRMLCVACCSAECMVRVATCCTALQPVATCCAGLQRVAWMCSVGERGAHPVGDGPRRLAHAIRRGRDLRRVLFPLPRACAANTWAHPDHVGTGTGLQCHVCIGTAPAPATSEPGLGSPLQYPDRCARVLQRRSHAHSRARAHPAPSAHDGSPAQASPCTVGIHTFTSPTEWLQCKIAPTHAPPCANVRTQALPSVQVCGRA